MINVLINENCKIKWCAIFCVTNEIKIYISILACVLQNELNNGIYFYNNCECMNIKILMSPRKL